MNEPNAASARHWLAIALGDMAAAETLAEAALPSSLRVAAEHAQQAAEKAMKAVIAFGGRDPQRTHHLIALRRQLPAEIDTHLPEAVLIDIVALNDASGASRYPEPADPQYTTQELVDLIATARLVVDAATAFLRECGIDLNGVTPR